MTSLSPKLSQIVLSVLLTFCSVSGIYLKEHHRLRNDTVFDWRTKGVISPVSNEGRNGNAYSIVIAEGVESLHAIQTESKVVLFSRQEVNDCCETGSHQPKYNGYECIPAIGGLCTLVTYKTSGGTCNNGSCTAVGKVTKTGYVAANREDLMVEVIQQTPLSTLIDSSQQSFELYSSGIYSDPKCSSVFLDHIVQIVGYGTASGVDYWILKNSWGTSWGEEGYMRILRGKNMCGVASEVFYPINQKSLTFNSES